MIRPGLLAAILLAGIQAALFCGCPQWTDDVVVIEEMLDARDYALSHRNREAFAATVAEDFIQNPSLPLTEDERVGRYFEWWPLISARSVDRIIHVDGGAARVVQRVILVGRDAEGRTRLRFEGQEELTLVHRSGRWLVTSSRMDLDAIVGILETRRRAMESRDLELYLSTVDPGYRQADRDFEQIRTTMERQFDFWDAIEMKIIEREITVRDNTAVANQAYAMQAVKDQEVREFPPAWQPIELTRNDAGAWRITGGL